MSYEEEKQRLQDEIAAAEDIRAEANRKLQELESAERKRKIAELGDKWWTSLDWRFVDSDDSPWEVCLVARSPGEEGVEALEAMLHAGVFADDDELYIGGSQKKLRDIIVKLGIVPREDYIVRETANKLRQQLRRWEELEEVIPPVSPWPHTEKCAQYKDCRSGFDHPRECDCESEERYLRWLELRGTPNIHTPEEAARLSR